MAVLCCHKQVLLAQTDDRLADSLYINYIEEKIPGPAKVLHAEPLYIDLIRDLGARKGEREWNFGMGITDTRDYDTYQALIEYEFAPADRLGLEVELPFTFYAPLKGVDKRTVPAHKIESLKTAIQWTLMVSPQYNTSIALGYINELELTAPAKMSSDALVTGNVFNPFLVVAKRWGNNFHSLVYTGPRHERSFHHPGSHTRYDVNTNIHYMITGTKNFVGIELNKEFSSGDFDMVIRPQLRVGITDNVLIGIVGGIPVKRESQGFSTFARLIWEPHH